MTNCSFCHLSKVFRDEALILTVFLSHSNPNNLSILLIVLPEVVAWFCWRKQRQAHSV